MGKDGWVTGHRETAAITTTECHHGLAKDETHMPGDDSWCDMLVSSNRKTPEHEGKTAAPSYILEMRDTFQKKICLDF